jgi:hypothetical protein
MILNDIQFNITASICGTTKKHRNLSYQNLLPGPAVDRHRDSEMQC